MDREIAAVKVLVVQLIFGRCGVLSLHSGEGIALLILPIHPNHMWLGMPRQGEKCHQVLHAGVVGYVRDVDSRIFIF